MLRAEERFEQRALAVSYREGVLALRGYRVEDFGKLARFLVVNICERIERVLEGSKIRALGTSCLFTANITRKSLKPNVPKLTKQERKVYDYLLSHRGATTRDIIRDTYVTCPSGRITEMRSKGVPIVSIGQRRYAGARAFECYAIAEHQPWCALQISINHGGPLYTKCDCKPKQQKQTPPTRAEPGPAAQQIAMSL